MSLRIIPSRSTHVREIQIPYGFPNTWNLKHKTKQKKSDTKKQIKLIVTGAGWGHGVEKAKGSTVDIVIVLHGDR